MITPTLEPVFELQAKLAPPIKVGSTHEGERRIIPILEGEFKGPRLQGRVLPEGAADWQFTRSDGVTQAEACYALRTDDGAVIQIENFGLRHGPDAVMNRLINGEDVNPEDYYFRANPRFKAPQGKYDWLNKSLFICSGARYKDAITLWFFEVT